MPSLQNGRHLGGDDYFVPTRLTNMETSNKNLGKGGQNLTTTRNDHGLEQESGRKEGDALNPFAKTSRIMRTPPRPRVDSCPELKPSLVKERGLEDRDKRKRTDVNSSSPITTSERSEEGAAINDDEVFVVEGSPSPGSTRDPKRKRELGPLSTKIGGGGITQFDETEDESAMTNGLVQMMQKLENMTSELSWQTKKHVNTKVEIKKLVREIDMMSQHLARKLHKYCKIVGKKLRKSSGGKEDSLDTKTAGTAGAETQDTACQTDPPSRKPRGEVAKKVIEASTDEEVTEAANKNWQDGWYEATTDKIGNPWNTLGDEDFAVLVSEDSMESGIARLLKDRFPEIGRIDGSGTMKMSSTAQVGVEDPVTRNGIIHKVGLSGTSDVEVLAALRELSALASQGSKLVAVPVPTGMEEGKFRKLTELVFQKQQTRVVIYIPQRKGGKNQIPQTRLLPPREINMPKRDKDTEVLLIKQGGKTYGDMVKGLRTMVGNQEVKALKQIRKTQDGRLLLAFKKGEAAVEDIKKQIEETWEAVEVSGGDRSNGGKYTVHVKGLDVAVDDNDIREAICELAPTLRKEDIDVGPRRPMFGGNVAVTVRVPEGLDVEQFLKSKRIKIGFNMCKVEERIQVTKCFRCWELGHIAKKCRGPDRRSLCTGCGQEGHLVADCKNPPHCLLCNMDGHRGGAGNCPKFKDALDAKRAWRDTQ